MKFKIKSTLFALAGFAIIANPAMGAVNLTKGELALVFYQYSGSGGSAVVGPNTYVFELGASSLYRENLQYNVSVSTVNSGIASSNIGTDLVNTFGANWYNNTGVRWMVVGSVDSVDTAINGDPSSTAYLSKSRSNANIVTAPPTTTFTLGDFERGSLVTSVFGFRSGTNSAIQTVGSNVAGSIIAKSTINSIDEFVPGDGGDPSEFFGQGNDPRQTFGSGTISNSLALTGSVKEGALDIFRFIDTTSGADLTAGGASAIAQVGTGQYIGTLLIDSTGNLSVIPEPSSILLGVVGSLGLCLRRRRDA